VARPTVSQQRQIADLMKHLEPQIEKAFLDAIAAMRGAIDTTALIEALKANDIERAVNLFRQNSGVFFELHEALRSGFIGGGALVGPTLPKMPRGGFAFNGRHWRAEAWIKAVGGDLIQGIQDDSLAMVRSVITSAITEGKGAQVIARDLTGRMVAGKRTGGFLGLTAQQADSIILGRSKLLSGDPTLMREYLDLKLRNKTYDAMINRAIANGGKLSVADADRIIEAHKVKALGFRGKTIARNEAFTAQAAGREEGYRQVLDRDDVESVSCRWQHNLSEFPRPDHLAMDGTVIKVGETFNFPDAQMKHPHDPAGGAKHSIGCRCVAIYRVQIAKE